MSLHLSVIFTGMSLYNILSYIFYRYVHKLGTSLRERESNQLVRVNVLSIRDMFVVVP